MNRRFKTGKVSARTADPLRVARRGLGFEYLESRFLLTCGARAGSLIAQLPDHALADQEIMPNPTDARLVSVHDDSAFPDFQTSRAFDDGAAAITKIEAVGDNFSSISSDASVALDVLANDQLPEKYELVSITEARIGTVSINLEGNVAIYTPVAGYEGRDHFQYTIRDAAGIESTAQVSITLTPPDGPTRPAVDVMVDVVSTSGQRLDSVGPGDHFLVNVYVQDVRTYAEGVFSVFVDVTFDPTIASVDGDIQFGEAFPNIHNGSIQPGLIDELGAMSGLSPNGSVRLLLATIPMVAQQAGELKLQLDPADQLANQTTVYGWDRVVNAKEITFAGKPLEFVASMAAVAESVAEQGVQVDAFTADELNVVAPLVATLNSPAAPLVMRATEFDRPDADPATQADALESMRTTGLLKLERDAAVIVSALAPTDVFPALARHGHGARDSILAARPNDQGWQEDALLDLLTLEADAR